MNHVIATGWQQQQQQVRWCWQILSDARQPRDRLLPANCRMNQNSKSRSYSDMQHYKECRHDSGRGVERGRKRDRDRDCASTMCICDDDGSCDLPYISRIKYPRNPGVHCNRRCRSGSFIRRDASGAPYEKKLYFCWPTFRSVRFHPLGGAADESMRIPANMTLLVATGRRRWVPPLLATAATSSGLFGAASSGSNKLQPVNESCDVVIRWSSFIELQHVGPFRLSASLPHWQRYLCHQQLRRRRRRRRWQEKEEQQQQLVNSQRITSFKWRVIRLCRFCLLRWVLVATARPAHAARQKSDEVCRRIARRATDRVTAFEENWAIADELDSAASQAEREPAILQRWRRCSLPILRRAGRSSNSVDAGDNMAIGSKSSGRRVGGRNGVCYPAPSVQRQCERWRSIQQRPASAGRGGDDSRRGSVCRMPLIHAVVRSR